MYEDIQSADKMIANLSALLRISLKNTNQNGIVFASELEILNLYLEIMKERFKDKLDVTLEIDDNLLEVKVPPFLFQPIVENSIKHGMENLSKLVLSIKAEKINDYAIVYIEDNGKGIEENSLKLTGVGLSNIAERLKKTFSDDYEFVWKNKIGGGLITKIVFPIKSKD
jgi:LytS/YehU family sensor histidine kinase